MRTRANDACVEQYSQRINCAQVKGSAKIMVTVVATQELKAEDFLLRFKAEASQDDIHGSRSISAWPVFGNYGIFLTCMPCFSSIFFVGSRVCVCVCVCM